MAKKKNKKKRPRGIPSRANLASGLFQIFSLIPAVISIFLPWWKNSEDSNVTFNWDLFHLKGKPGSVSLGDTSGSWGSVCEWAAMDDFCSRWTMTVIAVFVMVGFEFIGMVLNFIGLFKRDFITLAIAYGFLIGVVVCDGLIFVGATGTPAGLTRKDVDGGFVCFIISSGLALMCAAMSTFGLVMFDHVPPQAQENDGMKMAHQGSWFGRIYHGYARQPEPFPQPFPQPAPPAYYGQPGVYSQQPGMYSQQRGIGYGQKAQAGYAPGVASWPAASTGFNQFQGNAAVPVQNQHWHPKSTE
jgi:hypothetical protein